VRALAFVTAMTAVARAEPPQVPHDEPEAPKPWLEGDHATGDWGGVRDRLGDIGITVDVVYATEVWETRGGVKSGAVALGHVDAALTLDTEKAGLWPGGKLYVLGQNSHGTGVNDNVGSATQISNLEADPYTQLTELFVEQAIGARVRVRLGKQDANRDFGTPRFGGNFINNNFGMYPTSPLPSYPTTGLGAALSVDATDWLVAKAALYEGNPQVGSLGFDSAFADGAGYTLVGGLAGTRHWGRSDRHDGTTSVGVWRQSGAFPNVDPGPPRTFDTDRGFFVQHDEHIFANPDDKEDPAGLTLILRFGWAQADRTQISRYMGASAAWHGLGWRHDDTVGVAVGMLTVAQPLGGSPTPSSEWFTEAFYKWRLTPFVSLQPDLQFYRHPGGDGRDAALAGMRLKVKL
jgi:porin